MSVRLTHKEAQSFFSSEAALGVKCRPLKGKQVFAALSGRQTTVTATDYIYQQAWQNRLIAMSWHK